MVWSMNLKLMYALLYMPAATRWSVDAMEDLPVGTSSMSGWFCRNQIFIDFQRPKPYGSRWVGNQSMEYVTR